MALSELALTTVTAVETELEIVAGSDTRIEGWIEDVSALIASWLGRVLHRGSAIVEAHEGDDTNTILVKRPPLVAVGSVTYLGAAIAAENYEVQDADAGAIFFLNGLADTSTGFWGASFGAVPGSRRRSYSVTYAGGWITPGQAAVGGTFAGQTVTLPRALQRACLEQVCELYNRDGDPRTAASEGLLSYNVSYRNDPDEDDADGGGLLKAVRAKIAGYRLEVFSG